MSQQNERVEQMEQNDLQCQNEDWIMENMLFKIDLTKTEARKLGTALRQAAKRIPGKQEVLNNYLDSLYAKYGQQDPESCQMVIISNTLYVQEYPTVDELITAHKEAHPNA
jgi:hypothetical protein